MSAGTPVTPVTSLRGVFARFLRFGFLAFGGPVPQIAMLRRELVEEEGWVSGARFNRLLAVYQVLPGPEAHELAVHLGMVARGRAGAVLAGLGFMLPGFLLMLAMSWLYFQVDLGQPAVEAVFLGIQVAVVALVVRSVERIGRHVLLSPGLWLIAVCAGAATLAGISFLVTLGIAGAAHVLAGWVGRRRATLVHVGVAVLAAASVAWAASAGTGPPSTIALPAADASPTTIDLFLSGLKAGLLTFGGAYTAIPFLRGDAVGSGWLSDAQFLDGIALAGILPAPLIIFSTFVGYVAGGPLGAVAMTVGIFLPAFSFALLFGDRLEAVVDRPGLHRFLEGVAAGVIGLIAVTAVDLGIALSVRLPAIVPGLLIFAAALLVLVVSRSKATVPLVLAGAAVAGYVAFAVMVR